MPLPCPSSFGPCGCCFLFPLCASQAQGELDDAESLLFEAASTAKTVLGPDHPHTKIFEINLKGLRTAKAKREKTKAKQRDKKESVE